MKPKLILCLALVLSGGLLLAFLCSRPHGISLLDSETRIRASILKITPIGMPIEEIKTRIQTKLHPDSFYYYKDGIAFPSLQGVARGLKIIYDKSQLKHPRKAIGCEVGENFLWIIVNADWVFDNDDRLADVYVYKMADMP